MRSAAFLSLLSFLLLGSAEAKEPVALVATRRLEPIVFDLTLPEKIGLLKAGQQRELAFEVGGRVAHLALEGAEVATGESVAALGQELEAAQLRQAKLRLREARSQLQRVLRLRASQAARQSRSMLARILVPLLIWLRRRNTRQGDIVEASEA